MSHLLSLLLLVLLLSSTQDAHSLQGGEEKTGSLRALIGSRPPRCEGRCMSCGRCEAVQMPVIPQEKRADGKDDFYKVVSFKDDGSNYKPLGWKCKCGDIIFNP
ncbi:EPIDERMAL PATTERNING FACTOR-like protein 2 [Ananas comosus]|uniref:Epidermal patterning factor-like protein n=1 Tax=Ananas comosus TaxID=4615 RepID=A0A6P5F5N8_ANACO|nr:EPIDERMAL PATTERNING FACTOR-like protein 2 [Ananas comosus]